MDRDRNLLFGVFAVQLSKVSAAQLVDAAAMWASDRSRALPERLVEIGALSEKDRTFIMRIVDEAIHEHEGDASVALSAFGGKDKVDQVFCGSIVAEGDDNVTTLTPATRLEMVRLDDTSQIGVLETPGRYSHISEYDRGGMARVFLVHDQFVGRDVALKELLPQFRDSGKEDTPGQRVMGMMARFLQEARITGQLEHPSIVPVYELGRRNDGTLYYTMKFVRGRTLSKAISEGDGLRGRLPLLPHFIDLCNAIAYAHSRGIIHRDIKPSNIMVGEFGETVVLDWGLAKAHGQPDSHSDDMAETLRAMDIGEVSSQNKTAYGHAIGTPAYMPPEQARGLLDQIDERSDIYSLGAVLYEILTGKMPFTGKSTHEILEKVKKEEPEPIKKIDPNIPPELIAICRRSMTRDPAQRYASAKSLAQEIERFLTGALVEAYEYKPIEHIRRFAKRYKPIVLTASIAIVLIVALTGMYISSLRFAYQREAAQRVAAEEAEGRARQVSEFQTSMLRDIDVELMGNRLHEDLLIEVRAAMQRASMDEKGMETRIEQLEDLLAGANLTNTAVKSLDRNVLARALTAIDQDYADQPLIQAALWDAVASSYRALGLYDEAFPPQEKALETYSSLLDADHPDVLGSINNMGVLLADQGRYEEAEAFLHNALDGRRRTLGDDDPDTLTTISNMGILFLAQARYAEAENYLSEALDGCRHTLGEDHLDSLAGLKNMGIMFFEQGKYDEAAPYLYEALEGRRRISGNDHPDTLRSCHSVGFLLAAQSHYAEAEPYYQEALEGRRRVLGDDHPDTLESLNNMGILYRVQGKYAEAETCYYEALQGYRRKLGSSHPSTLASISNIGVLFFEQGKYSEAETYYREALEGYQRTLGDDHPDTLSMLSNLGLLLAHQGEYEEAETQYQKALEGQRHTLGDDHPDTLNTLNSIGVLLSDQKRFIDAEPYIHEALEGRRRVLGADHSSTLTTMNSMAVLLTNQGKNDEAEQYFKEILEGRRRTLGDGHPSTLNTMHSIAILLSRQGKYEEAESSFLEAFEGRRSFLGDGHSSTLSSLNSLVNLLMIQEKFDTAETLLLEMYHTLEEQLGTPDERVQKHATRLADFYSGWHDAEPDAGHNIQASYWRDHVSQLHENDIPLDVTE